jgi:hypothetical protein
MKKLIAFALAAFALNATAFTGSGNENIREIRNYLKATAAGEGTSTELQDAQWVSGLVAGLSSVFADYRYRLSICYPEKATAGQLAEIAARYIIDHPEERAKSLDVLVHDAHDEAFGLQMAESCWDHDRWLQYNS